VPADEQQTTGSVNDQVYDVAVRLLARYDDEEDEVRSWVTGSEIARETGLDKDVVLQALRELGSGRLYVNEAANGKDVEVVGVDHRSTEGGT
jgi:hypothetical protein